MSILNTVKRTPLFFEIYDEEVMKIVEQCEVLHLEPNEPIFSEGEQGDELFIIISGGATVFRDNHVLAQLKKGDLFGEMVLLNEKTRLATIKTNNYTDILVIKYQDIFGLYETNTKIFSILMLNIARMLSNRLKGAGERIMELVVSSKKDAA
jgi:CRP-like cAMP-binding protein